MKHTQEMLLIKIEDLVPSPYNVRRYEFKGMAQRMAASKYLPILSVSGSGSISKKLSF